MIMHIYAIGFISIFILFFLYLFIINRTVKLRMNQFRDGERIKVPGSFVRSVSFDKVREGSLSARNSVADLKDKLNHKKSHGYEKILGQKLNAFNRENIQKSNKTLMNRQSGDEKPRTKEEQQLKECTFHPKINSIVHQPRSVNEFVSQQLEYYNHKDQKVQNMRNLIKAKLEKQNTFQPNLSKKKNEASNRQPVHQRLYQDFRKRQDSEEKIQQKKEIHKHLKPKIGRKNSQSDFPSDSNELSSAQNTDRLSRNASNKSLNRGLSITKKMDVKNVCEAKLNKNKELKQIKSEAQTLKNKQIYIKKVLREITHILHELNRSNNKIIFQEMNEILKKMNFIDEQSNVDDQQKLQQIWQMLQGDIYKKISLINLIKIIFSLLNFHQQKLIQKLVEGYQPLMKDLESEQESIKKLVISEKESQKIKVKFEQLYLNRLKKGQFIHPAESEKYSFKPYVSKQSTEIASKYRQKILQESEKLLNENLIKYEVDEDGTIDHVDFLLLNQKCKERKLQVMRENQEKEKKKMEDELMRNRNTDPNITGENGLNRCKELYELGKNNLRQKKITQEQDIVGKQCTFQPSVQSREISSLVSKQNSIHRISEPSNDIITIQANNQRKSIPDFDKTIYRMYEGRNKRESTHKEKQAYREEPSPILYLNVNMEGMEDIKVPVFISDTMKTIAHKVRILAGFSAGDEEKLEEVIKLQIIPALEQFGLQ